MDTILQIWLVEAPEHTALFCRLILIQSLLFCIQLPFVTTIHATGKMMIFQLTNGIVLLTTLPISYFFLKAGGAPYIPFLVNIGALILDISIVLYLLKRWINLSLVSIFRTVFIPVSLIVVCTLPVSVWVSFHFPFLLSVMFSGLSVCISVYFIALDKETRKKVIHQVIHKFLKK